MDSLSGLRKEYRANMLDENLMSDDPITQFNIWITDAMNARFVEPNVMTLATSTPDGKPSARIVLLKEINPAGFVFFTNYNSRKGCDLIANSFAALVFDWHEIERQVRVEGRVEKLSVEDSDAYFDSRPETSKLGAWVSPQSSLLKNRQELDEIQSEMENKFRNNSIPRPEHWGGFLVRPTTIEFWQGRPNRLHDRIVYYKTEEGWTKHRLAP